MKPLHFVDALKTECCDNAVSSCVANFEKPPGRRPSAQLVRLSKWFNGLNMEERELVIGAMQEVADATLFGVLCVIDGVRTIEPECEKSEFKLIVSCAGVESVIAPSENYLHDLLQSS